MIRTLSLEFEHIYFRVFQSQHYWCFKAPIVLALCSYTEDNYLSSVLQDIWQYP